MLIYSIFWWRLLWSTLIKVTQSLCLLYVQKKNLLWCLNKLFLLQHWKIGKAKRHSIPHTEVWNRRLLPVTPASPSCIHPRQLLSYNISVMKPWTWCPWTSQGNASFPFWNVDMRVYFFERGEREERGGRGKAALEIVPQEAYITVIIHFFEETSPFNTFQERGKRTHELQT